MIKEQSIKSKKGEIEFRKKLFQQEVEGERIFNDEFDAKQIKEILRERIKKTFEQMALLKENGVRLSPYLEIGAERGQRSLVLENEFGAIGAALDISYYMLKSCNYYKVIFNKKKLPLRICCDVNHLPFMSNSVSFVFCYQTLHHFPDPTPIVNEIYRVLSPGGHFFFDEEPYQKILHLNLYTRAKIYSQESLNRGTIKKVLDYFFSRRSCNEIEYGIIENEEMSIDLWKKALRVFEQKDIKIQAPIPSIASELFHPKNYWKFVLAYLLGGKISGICRKSGKKIENQINFIYDALICPSCIENGQESMLTKRPLSFFCSTCGNKFPIVNGIVFLFSYPKLRELYPEIFKKITKI